MHSQLGRVVYWQGEISRTVQGGIYHGNGCIDFVFIVNS